MHQDEAIGADKFHELWASHKYTYDPFEYHGPTLNYSTLPVVWVSGAKSYPETTNRHIGFDGAVWGGVDPPVEIDVGWTGMGGESVRGGADRDIAGDEFLCAILHPRDAAGVFHLSGHRQRVEIFAEWEKAVGVSLWNALGWRMRRRRRGY